MNHKHAHGRINANGTIEGVSCGIQTVVNHPGSGLYTVVFTTDYFPNTPTVALTQNFPKWNDFSSDGGDTRDNAVIVAVSKGKVKIKTGDGNGRGTNRNFCIIALGE